MDCPHCQGRFGAHVPGCSNAGKSSEHMEVEHLRDKVERLEAENDHLRALLHTERQAIAKKMGRIKVAASHLEDAVYDAAREGSDETNRQDCRS